LITENLTTLKIHKLTQEQYERELAAGNIDENALYLTPDDGNSETLEDVVYAAEESVDTFAEVINADTLGGHPSSYFATKEDLNNIDIPDIDISQIDAGNVNIDLEGAGIGTPAPVNADTLGGIQANNYATKEFVASNAVSMTLLWENASLDSIFAAQIIPLDWSDYDFVLVEDGAIDGHSFTLIEAGGAATQQSSGDINPGYNGYTFVAGRSFFTVPEGIDVKDCYIKFANSNTPALRNDMIKPSKIYGIKGVTK
jgi:hypothetical protein